MSSTSGVSAARSLAGLGCVCLLLTGPASAESWRSPLLGRELVVIEKTIPGTTSPPQPLPADVQEKLGPDFVEYEAFVAARLPAAEARVLTEAALRAGRGVVQDPRTPVVLPFQTFRPEDPDDRSARWAGRRLRPTSVPGLYLIRFAFPLLTGWSDELRDCGADPILYYGNGVFLTRARNLGVIKSCTSVARHLSWADAFLATDRTSPALLDEAGLEMKPYSLVFAPGTTLDQALAELPSVVEAGGHMTWDDGTLSLGIKAGAPELEALAQTSLHLLSILEAEGEPQPSDERQGQIVAGNYTGYPGAISGAVTTPGYLTWLANRGLRTASNQQTVAVFDTGYDDGSGQTGDHHPDLENPERLIATPNEAEACYVFNRTLPIDDTRGHGTAVAGIIAGNGAAAVPVGAKDTQNFYLGTGIAPDVKLVAVQVIDTNSETDCNTTRDGFGSPADNIGNAITYSRVTTTGADKAQIASHSWNLDLKTYSNMAQLFDQRVIDGAPATAGLQPMTMVVSAGNDGTSGNDTVLSPATAKNVITVGSTQSYRPSTEAGAPTNSCSISFPSAFTAEANNIAEVGAFSSKGALFHSWDQPGAPVVTGVRVKPDLVAPGGRVFSTMPYQSSTYTCQVLCQKYWPAGSSYSFGSGTSFAAPVVTGVAALARKWFLDRGVDRASPSLIKAALIATATDIGLPGGDHRPSNRFGWGRVDLNRLTDPSVARFYVTDNAGLTVSTGTYLEWERTIDNYQKPVFIVLVWSDPASSTGNTSQVPLVNDLQLTVGVVNASLSYLGNNFNENIDGIDDGYSAPYAVGGAPMINDTMNNVEAVFLPANLFSPGQRIIIRATGADVHTPQKFAIYAYNVRLNS